MSVRSDILQNIIDSLTAIDASKDASFNQTVNDVRSGDILSVDNIAADITLGVFVQTYSSTSSAVKMGESVQIDSQMSVGIRAVIRGTVNDIGGKISGLVEDIETALFSDRRRGNSTLPVNTSAITISQESIDATAGGALGLFLATAFVTWSRNL